MTTNKYGFSSYQIKIIGLIFMTLDHFAKLIRSNSSIVTVFLKAGRIAAPLFLFIVIESAKHTSNIKKYMLRLYLGGVGVGLFIAITNIFFSINAGISRGLETILHTYFYTVLFIYIIDLIKKGIKRRSYIHFKKSLMYLSLIVAVTIVNVVFFPIIQKIIVSKINGSFTLLCFTENIFFTIFPTPFSVDYSFVFIIMGVLWYYAKNKKQQCIILAFFSVLYYLSSYISPLSFINFNGVILQHWMILAVPFICLYNGKRGKEYKLFFYLYYPLHSFILFIIFNLKLL